MTLLAHQAALRGLPFAAAFLLGPSGSIAMDGRAVDLELVLAVDASGSMAEAIPDTENQTRMEAAQVALREVIARIPERDGLNVGFRIYGHEGSNSEADRSASCRSTELLVGDCFSFIEGSNMARATVVPCDAEHTYLVIGQGTLNEDDIDAAGGLQNAVSVACASPFETYLATAAEGAKPTQEFVVSTTEEDGVQVTRYSCVTTDSA